MVHLIITENDRPRRKLGKWALKRMWAYNRNFMTVNDAAIDLGRQKFYLEMMADIAPGLEQNSVYVRRMNKVNELIAVSNNLKTVNPTKVTPEEAQGLKSLLVRIRRNAGGLREEKAIMPVSYALFKSLLGAPDLTARLQKAVEKRAARMAVRPAVRGFTYEERLAA